MNRYKRVLLGGIALLTLFAVLGLSSWLTISSRLEARADAPQCSETLQQQMDQATDNATLHVPACVYREQVTINKPLTLIADPGAEIRGSDIWTSWASSNNNWVSTDTVPAFSTHGNCMANTQDRCLWAEQVFNDGTPLQHVASAPATGQFAVDAERHILLGDDPAAHTIEVTTRTAWIVGGADNVTIHGFRMQHAASDAQNSAITPNGHLHWTIENNVLSDAHGAVVDIASYTQVLHNDISRGGDLGVHGGNGTDNLLQDNKIHDNNTDAFDTSWEAGGVKVAVEQNLTLDGNEIYNNAGPGAWCDISCKHVTYSNNQVHDNGGSGLFFEISDDAKIFNNKIWENGWQYSAWGWGAGILISNSSHTEAYNNVLAWNADGISIISIDRSSDNGDPAWNNVVGDYIHDNTVVMTGDDPSAQNNGQVYALGWLQTLSNGVLYTSSSDNRAANNGFWITDKTPQHFQWDSQDMSDLDAFAATPGGQGSHYLSDTDEESILTQAQIPLTPKSRTAVSQ